jgi:hypothetical protein
MKKRIVGLALIAMSLVTVNSVAQTPNQNTQTTPKQENTQCKKAPGKGQCKAVCPFEGMNLSDAQKGKLEQLNTKRANARAEKSKATKAEKQRKDSVKMTERRAAKKEYLEEIKAILTPDQYVVFLENSYVNVDQHHGKAMKQYRHHGKDMKGKPGKDGKKNHANRGTKNRTNAQAPSTNS